MPDVAIVAPVSITLYLDYSGIFSRLQLSGYDQLYDTFDSLVLKLH